MRAIKHWLRDVFGVPAQPDSTKLEKEIQSIIDEGEENGLLDENSGQMIQSILEFRETVVREIMVPRTEMVAVSDELGIEDLIETIIQHEYTRMPVYSGTIDNIKGILNVKDLLKYWSKPVETAEIYASLRKPYFIPETKNVNQLLSELKSKRYHMAIVIDEYGGTSGLVTLEDLLEEIVGDIQDEHDTEEKNIFEVSAGIFIMDGRTDLEEIEKSLDVALPPGKYETLAGYILHLIGRIPQAGEVIDADNLEMTIVAADERSIKKIKVRKIARVPEAGKEKD